jgi:hypothetical protein
VSLLFKSGIGAAVVIAAGIQFVRPDRTNPPTDPARSLLADPRLPRAAAGVLERSCRDCHSNDTRWPWYSNVAPVSWWVIDHVDHGRSHFNYSQWAAYAPADARRLLEGTCELAREGGMPLPSYLRMHAGARLTADDVATLCSLESLLAQP